MENPRELAVKALMKIEEGAYSNITLNQILTPEIAPNDRGLITELIYGCLQYQLRLDYIVDQFSNTKTEKMSPLVRNALRSAVYQMFFLDRVPDFAAVSQAVEVVKRHQPRRLVNFTNGVLRNISRNKDKIVYPNPKEKPIDYLSVFYSFPTWLVKRWSKTYGLPFTEELCKAFNQKPQVCIRVNTLKIRRQALKSELIKEGIETAKGRLAGEALYFTSKTPPLQNLKSFHKGFFQPQDEASMLVGHVSGVKPGDRVLDVAAAPGGKTSHMAQLMENKGEIYAWDIHPHRIDLIKETCKRLGIEMVKPELQNALKQSDHKPGSFDKVILDAPCSGLGVIRRKPDIKWKKTLDDIKLLKQQQKEMIEQVSRYVKPGGSLIYSICSIDQAEGEEVIDDFTRQHKDFSLQGLGPFLPDAVKAQKGENLGYIKLYPNVHHVDGFFIARLKRSLS